MPVERLRHDADHRAGDVADIHVPSEHGPIAAKSSRPEIVAHDRRALRDSCRADWLVILRNDRPTDDWCDAKHGEIAAGYEAAARVCRQRFTLEPHLQVRLQR